MDQKARLLLIRSRDGYYGQLDVPAQGSFYGYSLVQDDQREAVLADFRLHMQMAASHILRRRSGAMDQVDISMPLTNRLEEIGGSLYSFFIPREIRQAWHNLSGPLEIQTNDPTLPWELLCDDHGCLSVRLPLARYASSQHAWKPEVRTAKPAKDLRVLLISADPYDDLDFVHREVDDLSTELFRRGVGCERLGRGRAVWNVIQSKLRQRHYDVVHFAGHVEFHPQNTDRCGLVLEDGAIFPLRQIEAALNGHPLVFINGCYSAREVGEGCEGRGLVGEDAQGLASAFLQGGAWGFIGSQWFVSDELSYRFALQFYSHCLSGVTVAEALRATRELLRDEDERGFTWPAFVYFGDPTVRLVMPEPSLPAPTRLVTADPMTPTPTIELHNLAPAAESGAADRNEPDTPPAKPDPMAHSEPGKTEIALTGTHAPITPPDKRPSFRWRTLGAISLLVLALVVAVTAYSTRPTIGRCSPDRLRKEANVWVKVEGQHLPPGCTVIIEHPEYGTIQAQEVRWTSPELVEARFDLGAAQGGFWNVVVRKSLALPATLVRGFYIDAGQERRIDSMELMLLPYGEHLLTVRGEGFEPNMEIVLKHQLEAITVQAREIGFISPQQLRGICSRNLAPGKWDVVGTWQDGTVSTLREGLVILEPTLAPSPTVTPTSTYTPTSTRTPTWTPSAVHTRTTAATETGQPSVTSSPVPTPMPTMRPEPTKAPVPVASGIRLLEPGNGASVSGWSVRLAWDDARPLGPNQVYDVRLAPEGQVPVSIGWSNKDYYEIGHSDLLAGPYAWNIVRIHVSEGDTQGSRVITELTPQSETWHFGWRVSSGGPGKVDRDGDGFSPPADCNDNDAATHPGAPDPPRDGKDQNCDGKF